MDLPVNDPHEAPVNDALAIRPGEHACLRFTRREDGDRLVAAFVRDGLRRGHKVVYLVDREPVDDCVAWLSSAVTDAGPAIGRGQLVVRRMTETYMPEGEDFDAEAQIGRWRLEHRQALSEGYAGLSATGEGTWALTGLGADCDGLAEFEDGMNRIFDDDTITCLCQYDHGRFDPGTLSAVAESHGVDVPPALAALGRSGGIAAAHLPGDGALRLAGELDHGCSDSVTEVLGGYYHGDLALDLGDVAYVDVAGLRALRPKPGQRLKITEASSAVRRLVALLAWDTDPDVEMAV
jgi:hypothetical protein